MDMAQDFVLLERHLEIRKVTSGLSVVVHPGRQRKIKVILNPRQVSAFLCRLLCSQKSIIDL